MANRCCAAARLRQVRGSGKVDKATAQAALEMLEVDQYGLDEMDRKLLLSYRAPTRADRLGRKL